MTSADPAALPRPPPPSPKMWLHIFAGLCASFIGIGLARFSYTPLLPALIQAHWFSPDDTVYLGAANLAGYLIGAVIGRPLAAWLSNVAILRAMKVLVVLAFLACAFPLSVSWFFAWRLLSGIAGGTIMVLVAATVLPYVPGHRRGVASGAVFLGVGLGIAASGTVVPLLLQYGLPQTWIGLAVLAAILTAASWYGWPTKHSVPVAETGHQAEEAGARAKNAGIAVIYGEYALMAVGLVSPMVFLVDFVARGPDAGTHLGSLIWVVYGAGAIVGPPIYGFGADRLGARAATRLLLVIQALAVAGLAVASNHLAIALLALVIGSFPPGIAPLVLAWIREALHGDVARQNIVWSRATIVFAAFQAIGAYAFSAIFNATGGDHRLLFALGAAAIVIAVLIDFGTVLHHRP